MFLWAALVLMSGIFLGAFQTLAEHADTRHKLAKGAGIIAVVYGVLLVVGAATGGTRTRGCYVRAVRRRESLCRYGGNCLDREHWRLGHLARGTDPKAATSPEGEAAIWSSMLHR